MQTLHLNFAANVFGVHNSHHAESFQGPVEADDFGRPRCKNQRRLFEFISNSKILVNDRRVPPPTRGEADHISPLLVAVKLMCSHFMFDLEGIQHDVFGFDDSQRAVYMPTNVAPIYKGPDLMKVNMQWLSHSLDFFRQHMLCQAACTMFDNMDCLHPTQKPSPWQAPLRLGAYPLTRHWKGTYSYLDFDEMKKFRRLTDEEASCEFFNDKNIDEGQIQVCLCTSAVGKSLTTCSRSSLISFPVAKKSNGRQYSRIACTHYVAPKHPSGLRVVASQRPKSPKVSSSWAAVKISTTTSTR